MDAGLTPVILPCSSVWLVSAVNKAKQAVTTKGKAALVSSMIAMTQLNRKPNTWCPPIPQET